MREWKQREAVRKVHDELYSPSDPDDPSSDNFVTLIIKAVFSSEKELTHENAVWTLSVLESIFDVNHLSTKIDSDVIESWKGALDKVTYYKHCFTKFLLCYTAVIKYFTLLC